MIMEKIKKYASYLVNRGTSLFKLFKGPNIWKASALILGLAIFITQFFGININGWGKIENALENYQENKLASIVLPKEGFIIPVKWGDLGTKLVKSGVIDENKFISLYHRRGGLDDEIKSMLYNKNHNYIKIDSSNAGAILNIFWALGLANKNKILENGPMMKYANDPSRFASVGGWTLSKGKAMNHYSRHLFIKLNSYQQGLVERVSKNIYRPCCGNPTYFPDCNHGMAMLGLIELLASQGFNDDQIYNVALQVNSFWFPSTYLTIAKYLDQRGIKWEEVDAKRILGYDFSSVTGYRGILAEISPPKINRGASCAI